MSAIARRSMRACMLPAVDDTGDERRTSRLPIGARKLVWLRFTRLGDVDVSLLRPLTRSLADVAKQM